MPLYRVTIRGRNFRLNMEGQWEKFGFLTPRFAEAPDAEMAGQAALEDFRHSEKYQKLVERSQNGDNDPPVLVGEDIVPVNEVSGTKPAGLAFYKEVGMPGTTPEHESGGEEGKIVSRGAAMFVLFCTLCLISSFVLYVWVTEFSVEISRFLIAGVFSALPALGALAGFSQAVTGVSFTELPKTWRTLKLSQRILIAACAVALICPLALYIYFLSSLITTPRVYPGY